MRLFEKVRATIRGRVIVLLIVSILPMMLVEAAIYRDRFKARRAEELQANLEIARAFAMGFENFVEDVLHNASAVGAAWVVLQAPSADAVRDYLAFNRALLPAIEEYRCVDAAGRVVYSSKPESVGEDVSGCPFIREMMQGRESALSDLAWNEGRGRPVFFIGRAIRSNDGALSGMVTATIDADKIHDSIRMRREKGGNLVIFDRKGTAVYRWPHLSPAGDFEKRRFLADNPELERALMGKEALESEAVGFDGVKRVFAFAPVERFGWVAGASRPVDEMFAPVYGGLRDHALFTLVVLSVGCIGAFLVSREFIRPVKKLQEYAQAIGKGRFDCDIRIEGIEEFVELGQAFTRMAREIREREEQLEGLAKKAERKATEVEAILSALMSPTVVYGSDGISVRANAPAVWSLGFDPVGADFRQGTETVAFSRLDGVRLAVEDLPVSRALRGETVLSERLLVTSRKGRQSIIMVSAAPILIDSKPAGAVTVWHDVTEREKLLAELQEARSRLEERVRERTAELAKSNEALKAEIARRKEFETALERTNRELQDFIFIGAHDLQEPLRKIQLFSSMMQKRFKPEAEEMPLAPLRRIQASANRMQHLIEALLDYSKMTLKPEPFQTVSLSDTIAEVLEEMEEPLRETGARVEVGPLPSIEADGNRMRILFAHLIENALKFRSEQSPVIKIHGERQEDACTILIVDNGMGFDEAYLDRIFRPFQRLHGNEAYGGTGMGLAISRKIVEQHNGTLTARSTPGEGSTFILSLPLKKADPLTNL